MIHAWSNRRAVWCALAGAAGVAVLALLAAPTTSGLPSRPIFQTVRIKAAGSNASPNLEISNSNPTYIINDTDSAVDNRAWQTLVGATTLTSRTLNDARDTATNWLVTTRSGTGIVSVNIPSGTLQNIGVAVPTHRVVETATSGAAMRVGDSFTISKSADTARSSTAVSAVDGDLQITALPAGHYLVDFYLRFTVGAGGWRYQWDAPDSGQVLTAIRDCNGVVVAELHVDDVDITCAGTASDDYVQTHGATAKLMSTGDISISWAQNTSNAAGTTLQSDSYLRVTRID